MKIFITGGTGLTGNAILRKLILAGADITALYRNRKPVFKEIKWVQGDSSLTQQAINKILKNTEIVIHNAASLKIGNNQSEEKELQNTNITFTEKILEAAVLNGIKKFIFTSSLSFISKPLPQTITEDSKIAAALPYAVSKLKGEELISEMALRNNFNYNILRLSSPVGNDLELMHENVLKKWIEQSKNNEVLTVMGDGGRTQDFVSVEDIADAFLLCCNSEHVNGIFNIASGTQLSMLQLATMITAHYKNSFVTGGTDNNTDRWNISIKKAEMMLGYKPKYNSETAVLNLLNSIS